MSPQAGETDAGHLSAEHGFSLKSVCWGYREIFARAIDALRAEGWLGEPRREITDRFFALMKRADQRCFDHVLKEFLGALNPQTRWLMDLPGIFVDVVDLGQELASSQLHYGITFFRVLGRGGLGRTPEQVRELITHVRRLRETDEDLAVALVKGYGRLVDRLRPAEIALYLDVAVEIFRRNKKKALAFLEGTLQSAETYLQSLTRECRLVDAAGMMKALLKALTGVEFDVHDLGQLDSDDLIDRGSTVVCLYRWLYVPARIRHFDSAARNRDWYLLTAVVAAGMIAEGGFPCVHGHPTYRTCRDVVGADPVRLNLFQVVEYVRVLRRIRRRWPGARRLLDFALRSDFAWHPATGAPERLFRDAALEDAPASPLAETVREIADGSVNLFETAERLDAELLARARETEPGLADHLLPPPTFLPDFLFPGGVSSPPADRVVADLKRQARLRDHREDRDDKAAAEPADAPGEPEAPEDHAEQAETSPTCYVYDEWSCEENDYLRDYCFVFERRPESPADVTVPADVAEQARRVSRVFERFRPELARREKRLQEGESIDPDLLVEFLVQRRKEPSPKVRFYERPRVNRRDLAVLVLLDASGSTGEELGERRRIIDVEKHAALILAHGLASLGDRFSICGFNTNGRENCGYYVYKDFEEDWSRQCIARVLSAYPLNCTRIGPALRHSGWRLGRIDARQRLAIVITDGRPMDDRYDPNTRYAHYDVRMACEENARRGVHTFGISTEANSLADMEIMFPGRRFAILPDIRSLPRVLPDLYVRLTI